MALAEATGQADAAVRRDLDPVVRPAAEVGDGRRGAGF
jgi:hypothetical protein